VNDKAVSFALFLCLHVCFLKNNRKKRHKITRENCEDENRDPWKRYVDRKETYCVNNR